MTGLTLDKTMTVREVAEILKKDQRTIQLKVKELFPELVTNGKTTYLYESHVTAIKLDLEKRFEVKTKLEKALIVKQAMELLLEDVSILQAENKLLKPKADRLDLIAGSDGLILPREAGKIITGHPNNFLQWMVDNRIFYRSKGKLVPFSEYQNRGYFKVKESFNEIKNQTYIQTYFTPKGVDWISEKYREAV